MESYSLYKSITSFLFVFFLSALLVALHAENRNKVDSLLNRSEIESDPSQQYNIYEELAFIYSSRSKYDSAQYYIDLAADIATKAPNGELEAKAWGIKGKFLRYEGKFEKSLSYLFRAYNIAKELNLKEVLVDVANDIGVSYRRLTEDENALVYHLEALKIAEEIDDKRNIAKASNSLGIIYTYQGQYEAALDYFYKALAIEKERNNFIGRAINLNSIAWIYDLQENYEKAITFYKKSLAVNQENNNQKGEIICYNDLGKVYHKIGEYEQALAYYNKTLAFNLKQDDKRYIARSYINLGEVYRDLGNIEKSLWHLQEGLNNALKVQTKRLIMEAYEQLTYTYEASQNAQKALLHYKNYNTYKDSVLSEEKSKQIIEMQTRYETERKEQENVFLKNQNQLNEKLIQRQRILVLAIVSILLLIVALFFVLLSNRNKQRKAIKLLHKQKDEITNQNQEIQQQSKALEKAIQTKNKFFSIIAHDLINPFHAIIGYSNMLKTNFDEIDPEKKKEYIQLIHQTSSQTHELLINLLDWSLAQTNAIEFEPRELRIDELIDENVALLSGQAKNKALDLFFEKTEELTVIADLNMIQTVVRNLISNAIKFTSKGSIHVTCNRKGELCQVSVEDTGVGISEQNLQNLFNIDKSVSKNGTAGEKGTGIGLLLCKEFVQKNGGEIMAESQVGKGSKFTFTLPLVRN